MNILHLTIILNEIKSYFSSVHIVLHPAIYVQVHQAKEIRFQKLATYIT